MSRMLSKPSGQAYQFVLLCLDRQTGRVLWQRVAREAVPHEGHHRDHGYASFSPATDGQHVVAYFGSRGLYCYDLAGNLLWSKDLGPMRTKMSFGEGTSPALAGDRVIVTYDHEGDDFIAAFDVTTGRELWRTPREEDTSWATPLVVEHEGTKQAVVAATRKVRGYDLATGKLLWECAGLTSNVIPSPVAGDGLVFVTSGFRGYSLMAIRLGRQGDLAGTDAIAWRHAKNTPYVPSPLLSGRRLYVLSDNAGVVSCFDATSGKAFYAAQRLADLPGVYASPVAAAGRVYLVGRDGVTVVIKDADALEVLATNRLDDRFDATPAAAGNDLILRGHAHLYCLSAE